MNPECGCWYDVESMEQWSCPLHDNPPLPPLPDGWVLVSVDDLLGPKEAAKRILT